MTFKELEIKKSYSNKYGSNSFISSYCYYKGTEQIAIYIKTGYGASEKTIKEIISEHDLQNWISEFKSSEKSSVILPKQDVKPLLTEKKTSVNLPKNKNMSDENVKDNKVNNFDSMREILFDTMMRVKDGSLDIEKAKSISMVGQTIINSVKVEVDFLKLTGSKIKPKMIG